jgi:hypothetical protein
MARLTKEEFFELLHKPKKECDGYEIHLQYCWKNNQSKSIFYLTGLDFSYMLGEERNDWIKNPSKKGPIIMPIIYE